MGDESQRALGARPSNEWRLVEGPRVLCPHCSRVVGDCNPEDRMMVRRLPHGTGRDAVTLTQKHHRCGGVYQVMIITASERRARARVAELEVEVEQLKTKAA